MPEVQNPFSHRLNMTAYDKIKVAVCTVTLFPLRLICCVALLLLASLFGSLATACMQKKEEDQPLTGFRKALRAPIRPLVRGILFCMGFHWVKVKGKLASPAEVPLLAVGPHSSFIDLLAIWVLCTPSGVSRKENEAIPLVGACARAVQPVFVSRMDVNSRKRSIAEIKKRATSGGKWPHLGIFPEGTCTNRKCLITFKLGAFSAGAPVQPVVLRYPNRLDTVTWTWSGPGAATLLWLTMCQFHNYLEIEILPPYKPDIEEIQDVTLFARNVRKQMAKCLGVPVTEHSYEDTVLMEEGRKHGLPAAACIIEFKAVARRLGINLDHAREQVAKFASMDSNKDGSVTIQEFADFYRLPLSTPVKELFSVYDKEQKECMDFRQFLVGSAYLDAEASRKDVISIALKANCFPLAST